MEHAIAEPESLTSEQSEERREDPHDRNIRSRCQELLTLGTDEARKAENAAVLGYN